MKFSSGRLTFLIITIMDFYESRSLNATSKEDWYVKMPWTFLYLAVIIKWDTCASAHQVTTLLQSLMIQLVPFTKISNLHAVCFVFPLIQFTYDKNKTSILSAIGIDNQTLSQKIKHNVVFLSFAFFLNVWYILVMFILILKIITSAHDYKFQWDSRFYALHLVPP